MHHHLSEQSIIERLKVQDPQAQRLVYDRYAAVMFGVCRRYLKRKEDAEDALVRGMYRVFSGIESFQGSGSFEGWIRRIMVNESLMILRKQRHLHFPGDVHPESEAADDFSIDARLSADQIRGLLDKLPPGYRTVFNLYVLEGYKHHEIADLLGISIHTSKSQLILARGKLRKLLTELGY